VKRWFPLAVWVVALLGSAWAQTVRVVAAADLQYALPDLARAFESKNPGTKVQLTFGSSGKLFTQLTQGLEADIYFSAEAIYPKLLEERGLTEPNTRGLYAIGRMAIWLDRRLGLKPGPEALKDPKVIQLAIANPLHAPYGRATVTLLERYGLLKRRRDTPIPDFARLPWEAIPWERLTGGPTGTPPPYARASPASPSSTGRTSARPPSWPWPPRGRASWPCPWRSARACPSPGCTGWPPWRATCAWSSTT
jgi:molybdate transport system substrate-binding protein